MDVFLLAIVYKMQNRANRQVNYQTSDKQHPHSYSEAPMWRQQGNLNRQQQSHQPTLHQAKQKLDSAQYHLQNAKMEPENESHFHRAEENLDHAYDLINQSQSNDSQHPYKLHHQKQRQHHLRNRLPVNYSKQYHPVPKKSGVQWQNDCCSSTCQPCQLSLFKKDWHPVNHPLKNKLNHTNSYPVVYYKNPECRYKFDKNLPSRK